MESNITITFDGENLSVDDNGVDWFAFGCTAGMMAAEEASGEYRHNLLEFAEGIRGALAFYAKTHGVQPF